MVRRIGVLTGVIAMLLWSAPGALAEPPAPAPVPAPVPPGATVMSMRDLGSSEDLSFIIPRNVASTSVAFPVPVGFTPVALKANVELPIRLRLGKLAVAQSNRTLVRMDLPPKDGEEMIIPIAGAKVYGNYLSLDMTMTAIPLDGYCWDSLAPVRLSNLAVIFTGQEAQPATVADFVTPVARRVTIGLPANPSLAESDAAVQVASIMAGRYGGQNPDIALVPLPDGTTMLPGSPGPFERRVVVKDGGAKALTLQPDPGGPSLLISGTGRELTGQALLLNSDALPYAVSTTVGVDQLPETSKFLKDTTLLRDLNPTSATSDALWPQVNFEVDQTRFGHPIGSLQVHLRGSYTPLPDSMGGEVIVWADGETLDRWPTESSGVIDRSITVPGTLLKRSTTIQVGIRNTGQVGPCGEHLPMALRLDGNTEIQVGSPSTPLPQGFKSLPQAAMPLVHVGIGADTFGDTSRAAQIVVGLQRSSAVPLVTEVIPLAQAVAGPDSAVLVSSDGWTDTRIGLPFNADKARVTVNGVDAKGESVTLNLEPEIKYGALQTVVDGPRTLLVATSNGAPAQLDELLRWATAERGRWAGLNGRALISVPGSEPVTVPTLPAEWAEGSGDSAQVETAAWFWPAVGGVAAVAAIGALMILLRARRNSAEPHKDE